MKSRKSLRSPPSPRKEIDTPAAYPLGDEPKITDGQRRQILDNPRPTEEELSALDDDFERTQRKVPWGFIAGREDAEDRAHSATATAVAIYAMNAELASTGARYALVQSAKASRDRDPLNRLIDRVLRGDTEATAKEVWDAISSIDEVDEQGGRVTTRAEEGLLCIDWWSSKGEEKCRDVRFAAFPSRVSRRRKVLGIA